MKKIVTLILLLASVLSLSACSNTKEITIQDLYDACSVPTLLEKHDSVYVQHTENGEVYQENYYSKKYRYSSNSYGEDEYAILSTDHSCYMYVENMDAQILIVAPDGMVDMKSYFAEELDKNIFSTTLANDIITSVTEKDGQIIVTSVSDQEELDTVEAEGWTLGEEEHVLDAKTREVLSGKGSYTNNETKEVYEGAMRITYDGEIPESMKKFVEYDQQTENMRTVTIVSNPGAENEKAESIQVPKGLQVALSDAMASEEENYTCSYTLYADAACTQFFEEAWDANSDLTIYIKWDE